MLSTSSHTLETGVAGRCTTFQYDFHRNIILSVTFGLAFAIGTVLVFIGYRILRVSLLMQTFAVAATVTHVFLLDYTKLSVPVNCVVSVLAGLVLCVPSALVVVFGLVFSGAVQGLFFTITSLFVLSQFMAIQTTWLPIALVIGLSLIMALPAILWQKSFAIMYLTSFGGVLVMLSIDFYLNLSQLRKRAYELILLKTSRQEPCWYSWSLYGLWPLIMVLGCLVQFLKTARGCDHRGSASKLVGRSRKHSKKRLLSDQGDFIAQAWIQTSPDVLAKRRIPSRDGDDFDDEDVFLPASDGRHTSTTLV